MTVDDSLAGGPETIGVTSAGITGLTYAGSNGSSPGTQFPFSIFGSPPYLTSLTIIPADVYANAVTVSSTPAALSLLELEWGPQREARSSWAAERPGRRPARCDRHHLRRSATSLTIDDSADTSGQTVSIGSTQAMFDPDRVIRLQWCEPSRLHFRRQRRGRKHHHGDRLAGVDVLPVHARRRYGNGNAVTFGDTGNPASSIMGNWLVEDGPGGTTSLTVNDTSDTSSATVSLNDNAGGGSVVFGSGTDFFVSRTVSSRA